MLRLLLAPLLSPDSFLVLWVSAYVFDMFQNHKHD